jgi:hypothetical protein
MVIGLVVSLLDTIRKLSEAGLILGFGYLLPVLETWSWVKKAGGGGTSKIDIKELERILVMWLGVFMVEAVLVPVA